MKIRSGFISNSSSSSFIISRKNLSLGQIYMIKNHIDVCDDIIENRPNSLEFKKLEYLRNCCTDKRDEWDCSENDHEIRVYTIMDNFDMRWFLENIVKIDDADIKWDDY